MSKQKSNADLSPEQMMFQAMQYMSRHGPALPDQDGDRQPINYQKEIHTDDFDENSDFLSKEDQQRILDEQFAENLRKLTEKADAKATDNNVDDERSMFKRQSDLSSETRQKMPSKQLQKTDLALTMIDAEQLNDLVHYLHPLNEDAQKITDDFDQDLSMLYASRDQQYDDFVQKGQHTLAVFDKKAEKLGVQMPKRQIDKLMDVRIKQHVLEVTNLAHDQVNDPMKTSEGGYE